MYVFEFGYKLTILRKLLGTFGKSWGNKVSVENMSVQIDHYGRLVQ